MPPLLHGQAEAGRLRWSHRPLRASLRPAQGPLTSQYPIDPSRRAPLIAARTAALARSHFGIDAPASPTIFATAGAALGLGDRAIIDLGDAPGSGLGAALVWALRHAPDATRLDLVSEDVEGRDLGLIARQAQQFDLEVQVWHLDGTSLRSVEPTPYPEPLVPPPTTAEQVLLLEQAGLEVVVEQGEIRGEILGLEVARVVVGADDTASLQVGIGRFDREAFGLLHGQLSPPEALAQVIHQVRALRTPDAEPHPVNRLARERWLRTHLVAHPELVGAAELAPVEPATARGGLREGGVASAVGRRADGSPVMVAASVGVDLDAVPEAGDSRAWHVSQADASGAPVVASDLPELVIAVPAGDAHRVTHDLAARLKAPATVAEIAIAWPR